MVCQSLLGYSMPKQEIILFSVNNDNHVKNNSNSKKLSLIQIICTKLYHLMYSYWLIIFSNIIFLPVDGTLICQRRLGNNASVGFFGRKWGDTVSVFLTHRQIGIFLKNVIVSLFSSFFFFIMKMSVYRRRLISRYIL